VDDEGGALVAVGEAAAWPPLVPSSAAVSARMSRFPRRDTAPEVGLRRLLHARGMRYRVNLPVPGLARRTIDIAFPRAKVAVFVDGCYWHGCPQHGRLPRSNREWWAEKLRRNQARDAHTAEHLSSIGWLVLRLWAHEEPSGAADTVARIVNQACQVPGQPPAHA
jgi:DNA mismatch endonuclease, patch repair protein